MKEKAGTLSAGLVWIFALVAVGVGIGGSFATSSMGASVTSAVYFGVFAVAGFFATYLTRSGKGLGILAFLVASVLAAGVYYYITTATVAEATGALAAGMGAKNAAANVAAGAVGSLMGGFVAIITFIVSFVAGLGGCLAGAAGKRKALAA